MTSNYPEPRVIPEGKILIAEAREVNDTNRSRVETFACAWSPRVRSDVRLVWSSPGFEPAGSCCRWTNGFWAVWFTLDNARHGRRYTPDDAGEAKAREHLARLIADQQ